MVKEGELTMRVSKKLAESEGEPFRFSGSERDAGTSRLVGGGATADVAEQFALTAP
jgi:hypothetical protein